MPEPRNDILTILSEESSVPETALLREAALAEDWNCPAENLACSHLRQVQSS